MVLKEFINAVKFNFDSDLFNFDNSFLLDDLIRIEDEELSRLIKVEFSRRDLVQLGDLIYKYLIYLKYFNHDPVQDYELLQDAYKVADKLFAQPDTAYFVDTLRKFTTALVDAALLAGRSMGDTQLVKAGEAARMFARPMGIAAADRSNESPSKRDALFFLANATFKIYFALNNLRLCDTVINNTSSAANLLDEYPKADRVAFHYYRGRIALYQRRLGQARKELQKAFNLCSVHSPENARLIFVYLITASLPLGIFPTFEALEQFGLFDQYAHLITALQVGNFKLVVYALDNWREWHLKKGNYLLLREKLETICWRNLIRRTLFISTNAQPLPPTGPPSLALSLVLKTARIAFGNELELDLDDIECICSSLMDQGYIKAYIVHSKKLLVLQKGPLVGFPPIASVRPSH